MAGQGTVGAVLGPQLGTQIKSPGRKVKGRAKRERSQDRVQGDLRLRGGGAITGQERTMKRTERERPGQGTRGSAVGKGRERRERGQDRVR